MRVLITLAALFCFAANAQANSSAATSYESHETVTWGYTSSGGSHGEMRRGQQRRGSDARRRCGWLTPWSGALEIRLGALRPDQGQTSRA